MSKNKKQRESREPRNDKGYDKTYFLKPESYAIDEIVEYINSDESYVILNDTRVKVEGLRLNTFTKHTVCSSCGRAGSHFRIASKKKKKNGPHTFHLCLWSDDKIQMTKDHIIPKSKGGADHLSNMQCMCTKCNMKKGNKITDDDIKKGAFVENYDENDYIQKEPSRECIAKTTGLTFRQIMKKYDPNHEDIPQVFRQSYIGKLSTRISKWSCEYKANVYELTKDHSLWDQAKIDGVIDDAKIVLDCVREIVDAYEGSMSVEHKALRLVPKKQRRKLLHKWEVNRIMERKIINICQADIDKCNINMQLQEVTSFIRDHIDVSFKQYLQKPFKIFVNDYNNYKEKLNEES